MVVERGRGIFARREKREGGAAGVFVNIAHTVVFGRIILNVRTPLARVVTTNNYRLKTKD